MIIGWMIVAECLCDALYGLYSDFKSMDEKFSNR